MSNNENINFKTYSSKKGVSSYINTLLQPPEVSIFVKYKDFYYNKNILDIGCGAGRTSFYFRNFSHQYTGIDYSERMIDYCKNTYPELLFKQSDVRNLAEFKDNSFDFIMFSYNGIDYINDAERKIAFNEITRVLKKEGLFVFSTHNRSYKNIELKPDFNVSLNPVNFFRNAAEYILQISNHLKLKKKQVNHPDYAILNDQGNNFSLLTYYITKEKQIKQIHHAGLELIEIYNMDGQPLQQEQDDTENLWLYFVTQKR